MTLLSVASLLALSFIWIGYPLAVAGLAALRRRDGFIGHPGEQPVSIILATSGDTASVRARVANLLAADYPGDKIEVVVAIDAARSRASLTELSGMDPRVTVMMGDAPGGKAVTLNAAVRQARHETLVFADTAQSFNPTAIAELVRSLSDPTLGAVSGMLELPTHTGVMTVADRYWHYERWLRNAEARLQSGVGVTGAIYAMRRSLWEPLPAGLILDDAYIPMRLVLNGWRVGFTDRARAFDARRFAAAQEYRRKVRTLTGVIQLCAWMPNVLNPVRNPVWIQFTSHKLLRLLTPYLAALCVLGVIWRVGVAIVASAAWQAFLVAAVIGIAGLGMPRVRRTIAAEVAWIVALQTSVIVATLNGLRGRWDVWQS